MFKICYFIHMHECMVSKDFKVFIEITLTYNLYIHRIDLYHCITL